MSDAYDRIEAWWLNEARQAAKSHDDEAVLAALLPHVRSLSDLFTTERPQRFTDYAADALERAAYGLFFFPQTFTRVQFPLDEAVHLRSWRPAGEPMRVLDLGSGTGGSLWGAVSALRRLFPGRRIVAEAVDHSLAALSTSRRLGEALFADVALTTRAGDLRRSSAIVPGEHVYDLITVGFAFNEAFAAASDDEAAVGLDALRRRLTPEGLLLVLEPALQPTARRLVRMREGLIAAGAHVAGPCLHAGACPMAQGKVWCHEVRRWTPPASLSALNRRLHREVDVVKYSYLAVGRRPFAQPPKGAFRLVSALTEEKGRLRTMGCFDDGALREVEVQTRTLSKADHKRFYAWERGDVAEAPGAQSLAGGERVRATGPEGLVKVYPQGAGRGEDQTGRLSD